MAESDLRLPGRGSRAAPRGVLGVARGAQLRERRAAKAAAPQ